MADLINMVDQIDHGNNNDPHRTTYHFQPPQNWMNDPNGPLIYKGVYHLFYQYNPNEPIWVMDGLVWGHSTSTDLINWTSQPNTITPTHPYDIKGCWSGSTTILPGEKPAILYTGIDHCDHQVQNLAVPKDLSDPYLREWIKAPENPVMVATPTNNNIDACNFRDPTTAWQLPDGKWRTIIGTQQGEHGSVALYTSEDFITWSDTGRPFYAVENSGMWECPDFFPVYVGKSLGVDTSVVGDCEGVKHVLKMSLVKTMCDVYTIGMYDTDQDLYMTEDSMDGHVGLRCDYGKVYGSKSFFDSKTDRRIVFGWVNESSVEADNRKRGWAGLQGIPRTIVLDTSGNQLVQWPITEVEMLRRDQVNLSSQVIGSGSLIEITGVTASQADVEVSFKIPDLKNVEEFDPSWINAQILSSSKGATEKGKLGPFGLLTLASTGLEEYTAVFFRIFKAQNKYVVLMCSDQSRSSLNPTTDKISYGTFVDVDPVNEELSLRILIDHSIVESFGAEGKNCITARVYPTLAINEKAKLYAFNYGTEDVEITKLSAWSMNAAQVNLPIGV